MTSWTKVTDGSTEYGSGDIDYVMTSEDGEYMLTEDGEYIVAEGPSVDYTKVADGSDIWASFGGLLYLATEGLRELIMTEGPTDYIVVSKGVESGTWAEVADVSTSYTKVIDA